MEILNKLRPSNLVKIDLYKLLQVRCENLIDKSLEQPEWMEAESPLMVQSRQFKTNELIKANPLELQKKMSYNERSYLKIEDLLVEYKKLKRIMDNFDRKSKQSKNI